MRRLGLKHMSQKISKGEGPEYSKILETIHQHQKVFRKGYEMVREIKRHDGNDLSLENKALRKTS